jgi:protein TonB
LAAGGCVALLHVLIVWGFVADFSAKRSVPPAAIVRVVLLPKAIVRVRLLPPPLPRLSTTLTIRAVPPQITIAPKQDIAPAPTQLHSPVLQRTNTPTPQEQTAPPPKDYISRLVAYLNAYKNYPYDARIHREQGTVRLHFRMDRTGHVLSYEVVGSSGSASLDDEARAMIQRAQPLPPPPPDFPGDILDLIVPVVFSLE